MSRWASGRVRKRSELERFAETGSASHWCGEGCSHGLLTEGPRGAQGSVSSLTTSTHKPYHLPSPEFMQSPGPAGGT